VIIQVDGVGGWTLGNLDATILAQAPKMAPHILQMRQNLSEAIGCDISQISIKATTEEKLGFTGNEEGIAAHCVCLLQRTEPPVTRMPKGRVIPL
jgi:2-C-methyl-D-erythritol 2,4-cyclodiphosphate synthase